MNNKNEPFLSEEARQERNKYMREWRSKNREKVRAYQNSYWLKRVSQNANQENMKDGTRAD